MDTSTTDRIRPNAIDRLTSLYRSPGPYVSFYTPCGEFSSGNPGGAFAAERELLASHGATDAALDAIEARLKLPVPDDVGGWAVHAASDGSTAADFAAEGPEAPFVHVGALPIAAPMIEWDQWRVPHATVMSAPTGIEIVCFQPGEEPTIVPAPTDPAELALNVRQLAVSNRLRLIVVAGEPEHVDGLMTRLRGMIPPYTNIEAYPAGHPHTPADIADFTVRYVADVVARDTVQALEDFRFFDAGDRAVQGSAGAFVALAEGRGERLLLHDDPRSTDLASFGTHPHEISVNPDRYPNSARRADVAIWSALQQRVPVRVIPSTSSAGPDDNIVVTVPRS